MIKKILRYLLYALAAIAALVIVVYMIFVFRSQPVPPHPWFASDDPLLVIAHQGGDGERPSNTMMAFDHAVEIGADILEMDIHSSADGVLVVIHDDTVDRTTDGTGRVNDMTLEELQALDAGYHWPTLAEEADRTDRPFRGQGATIPALEEILQAFPDKRMVIEIKQPEPPIHEDLCALLREYDMQEKVIVGSFYPAVIYAFRETCPEVATSAVEEEIRPFVILNMVGLSRAYQSYANAFQVPEYGGGLHVVTRAFVEAARVHNIMVQPWTINDAETMQRMIDLNVNGIITDYPSMLLEMLGRS